MTFFKIKTKRLFLGPLNTNDAASLFSYRSDPEVYRYQSWKPLNLDDAVSLIERSSFNDKLCLGKWNQLGILLNDSNQLIGDIGILIFEKEQAEIGFTISPSFQRKGFGFEAVFAMLLHLFHQLHFHRVIAQTDPQNVGSIKLLTKLGFRQEGHFRKSSYIRDDWKDDLFFAILGEEFQNNPGTGTN